jgi:hypothetical protein
MNLVSHDNMVLYLLYKREQMFQRCDAASRLHQRVVRVIACNDLAHVSIMSGGGDRKFIKALAEASKIGEVSAMRLLTARSALSVDLAQWWG